LICPFDLEDEIYKVNFNFALSSLRVTIERTFGKFKSQWRLLHTDARHDPDSLSRLIFTAAILHNLTILVDADNAEHEFNQDDDCRVSSNKPEDSLGSILPSTLDALEEKGRKMREKIARVLPTYRSYIPSRG
jgi:hypothetical protein